MVEGKPGRTLSVIAIPGAPDGSGYHRMWQPFSQLAKNSRHLCLIPPPGEERQVPTPADLAGRDIDVFIRQRPVGQAAARLWDRLDGVVARVYEVDDDLLRIDTSSAIMQMIPEVNRDSVRYQLSAAELVTVSSPHLAEECSRYSRNVAVLPNMIHEDVLSLPRVRRDRVTVGWAGGSSHLADIAWVQEPLRDVLAAHPEADMHWVGMDFSPLAGRECRFSPWEMNVWDYYRGIDFDIGLAPLAPIPFNDSKSYLKALDYAALGIPVIASDLPPYREFVVDGVTGFLVRTADEWRARLAELVCDADAREEMGVKARQHAAGFTIQEHWRGWEAAYERATGR